MDESAVQFSANKIDFVAGIDAPGFILGAAVAGIATVNMDENEATRTLQGKYQCYVAQQ